jgi:phage terminase large subunit-like protein
LTRPVLQPIPVTLPSLHPAQREVAHHPARFRVLCTGRRFGKTKLGAVLCVAAALEGKRVWWVAPSYPMASIGWRAIKQLALQVPRAMVRESERMVEMPSGGRVQVKSADNPVSLRGEGLDLVIIDECAYVLPDAWAESLRPALSDHQGRALFISTPNRRNWFHALYMRGLENDPDWCSWQLPTSANPFIDPAEIEAARREMSEDSFSQEYEAQFLEGAGAVFRNITACLRSGEPDPADHAGHEIVIGVDWAQAVDFTAFSVFCCKCRCEVELDRFNGVEWALQRGRLAVLAGRWRASEILVERNSIGSPLMEALRDEGLPVIGFTTTVQSKPRIIQSLALAFEREEATWLDVPVATAELKAFEARPSSVTGRVSYSAPEGCHDDTVIARALAWRQAQVESWEVINET